jgi:hypothetical protein
VESSSFTDVNSGALISAALKMMKGVDQMDRAAKEAETQAKREYSKREALKSTFESLKGNISVMCRVRKIKGNESTCSFPLEDTISVADRDVKGVVSRKKFAFDRIFEPEATQTQVGSWRHHKDHDRVGSVHSFEKSADCATFPTPLTGLSSSHARCLPIDTG